MGLTEFVKNRKLAFALLILVIVLFNLVIFVPFYSIDPHSLSKSEYFYGHSGTIENGSSVVWNRNLHCGMPQYDKVFWHIFIWFYYLLQAHYFYALLIVLAALGVFLFCWRSGYDLTKSLITAFIYGISFHFLEFLPVWIYGWGLMLLFLPWIAYLIQKLQKNGSLLDIAFLTLLLSFTFRLYETEITIYLMLGIMISVLFNLIDSLDSRSSRKQFFQYLWKLILAISLAMTSVITVNLPLMKARNQNILDPLIGINLFRIAGAIILIAVIFLLTKIDKKKLALYLAIAFLILANIYVLISYVPWLHKYQQRPISAESGSEIIKYLEADSTQFRILPLGNEFHENLWTSNFQSIGGRDQFALNRYNRMISSCLATEIDKNLMINWNLLDLLNVKYLISSIKIPSNRLSYQNYSYQEILTTYQIKDPMPYAWFASNWQLTSIESIINAVNSPEFDARKLVLLENEIPEFTDEPDFPESKNSSVQIELISAEQINIRVENDQAGLLVISEIYDEQNQWHAYIDSTRTAIYPVDYVLRGVVTPPGKHLLEMKYEPENLKLYHRISYWARMMMMILFLSEIIYRLWLKLVL